MAVDGAGQVYTAESRLDEFVGPTNGSDPGIFLDKLSFGVNILLRAIASSGSVITNRVTVSARTQDLNQSNNAASASVMVQ